MNFRHSCTVPEDRRIKVRTCCRRNLEGLTQAIHDDFHQPCLAVGTAHITDLQE